MNKLCLVGTSVVMVCMFSRSAVADGLFKYNYIEADYQKTTFEISGYSEKYNISNFNIIGSYAIHEMVAIQASYLKYNYDFNASTVSIKGDGNTLNLNIDLHRMVTNSTEVGLILGRSQSKSSATVNGANIDSPTSNSNQGIIRARTAIIPGFHLSAVVGRSIADDSSASASTSYSIGAEFLATKIFSLVAEYGLSTSTGTSIAHVASLGGRYYF